MLKDPSIQLGLKANVKGEMRAEMKASKRSRSHLISFKLVEGGGGWGWGRGRGRGRDAFRLTDREWGIRQSGLFHTEPGREGRRA